MALLPVSQATETTRSGSAESFPLAQVRLLEGPFKEAMERNSAYLLSLEPDRLLHNTRRYAGLEPKAEIYGGWESQGIAGHTLGHYLTALSLQYSATGDHRFRERIDYLVDEMAECQRAYGDGYIGALPPKELETLRALKHGAVEPNSAFGFAGGAWVPWYTQHKILAGLKDAWLVAGNEKAKEVTLRLADWVDALTANLSPQQVQAMLHVEHGGMMDTLYELYAQTKETRHLELARRFYHEEILDPLLAGEDKLDGRHANTQIPKIIGEARAYETAGDADGRRIAEFFWDTVVHHRTWAIGGNSDREHFFPLGQAHSHLGPQTAESCNTYNMLKLTEHLFEWNPRVELADYYERALYNHILASQEPRHGMFAYFMSLKPGHSRVYSTPADSFWCCVGSGIENHTKYGQAIYYHAADRLYVNLFIPSVLNWEERGLVLIQRTDYPRANFTEFTFEKTPSEPVSILIRCPAWARSPLTVELNGKVVPVSAKPGEYAEIRRTWSRSDRLRVTIPMSLRSEPLEGSASKQAFFYGPLVLAGDLGPAPESSAYPYARNQADNDRAAAADVPVLVRPEGAAPDLAELLIPVHGEALAFRFSDGVAKPRNITLRPFNALFYQRYTVYWDVLSQQEWRAREEELQAEVARQRAMEARIVDELTPGEQQSEIDHGLISENSEIGDFQDRKWRDARDGGWFEFRLKTLKNEPLVLRCTYWGEDRGRLFDIVLDGQVIATQAIERDRPGQFFEVEYPLPSSLLAGKDSATICLQAHPGKMAGGLFHAAMLRSPP